MSENNKYKIIEIVFPNQTNHYGTLFGGIALQFMDKMAFIIATKTFRKTFVTASSDRNDFKVPVKVGELLEVTGEVIKEGKTSCTIRVQMYSENPLTGKRKLCTVGDFVMVAVDENNNPTPIK